LSAPPDVPYPAGKRTGPTEIGSLDMSRPECVSAAKRMVADDSHGSDCTSPTRLIRRDREGVPAWRESGCAVHSGLVEPFAEIAPSELKRRLDSGEPTEILDVREPWEHEICAIPGARLIPMDQIVGRVGEIDA